MNLGTLIREAITAARTAPVPSLLILLVVAAMCLASIVTVGRQAAVESAVSAELSGPAARTLTVSDTAGSGALSGPVVQGLQSLDTAQAVIARQAPVDAVNGALGPGAERVAVAGLLGDVDQVLEITSGRLPSAGEAVVPLQMLAALRLAEPSGLLQGDDGTQWPIVGSFSTDAPFEDLQDVAVTVPALTSETTVQQIRVVATHLSTTRAMQQAALAVIDLNPQQTQISTATALSERNQSVTGELAGLGRSLLLLILAAGAFFVAVVVLADVLIRRRDLGRRRTLGISRPDLIVLVSLRTTIPALIGAVLGAIGGRLLLGPQSTLLPWDFTVAVAALAAITALLSSLPPAIVAATRDPVRIMRTA